jgi:DNA uptake protein ComE-like DNA-binding protein
MALNRKKIIRTAGRLLGDYLSYNKTEQRGVFILLLIITGLIAAKAFVPEGVTEPPPDFSFLEKEVLDFTRAWEKAEEAERAKTEERYSQRNQTRKWTFDTNHRIIQPEQKKITIDLNSADTLDLQQLRGIGPGFARRIVAYRERLGGFFHQKQVLEVFGMDSARYLPIIEHLTVNRDSIRKMDINKVSLKELIRHPYFPFPLAKSIIQFRLKNKQFKSLDELKEAAGLSDSLFRRMVVYLRL